MSSKIFKKIKIIKAYKLIKLKFKIDIYYMTYAISDRIMNSIIKQVTLV